MITFTVTGHPEPQGSTRAFMPKGARFPVVTSDNPSLKQWRHLVAYTAQQHAAGGPLHGGVHVELDFTLQRPKSLSKSVRQHLKKPDIDKLARAILDALTGILFPDDSEVVRLTTMKRYAPADAAPGVSIRIVSCEEIARLPYRSDEAERIREQHLDAENPLLAFFEQRAP